MDHSGNISDTIQQLLIQVQEEPNNWGIRKKVALMLYDTKQYLEAANVLWQAPEMPATDVDVAFSIKIISRARPALNVIGMPMLASRFYGAAMAEDAELFSLTFEKQVLWFDDSGILLDQWMETDQNMAPPLVVPLQDFAGDMIQFDSLKEHPKEGGVPTKMISEAGKIVISKPAEGNAGARALIMPKPPLAGESAKPVVSSPVAPAPPVMAAAPLASTILPNKKAAVEVPVAPTLPAAQGASASLPRVSPASGDVSEPTTFASPPKKPPMTAAAPLNAETPVKGGTVPAAPVERPALVVPPTAGASPVVAKPVVPKPKLNTGVDGGNSGLPPLGAKPSVKPPTVAED